MKCAPAGHTAQAEQVRLAQLAVELHPAFIPVHLRLAAPAVGLWHEGFQSQQSHRHRPPPSADMFALSLHLLVQLPSRSPVFQTCVSCPAGDRETIYAIYVLQARPNQTMERREFRVSQSPRPPPPLPVQPAPLTRSR